MRAEAARKKRRRRNIILCTVLAFALVVVVVLLCLNVFFKVSSIQTAGDEIYNTEQVTEASGITVGAKLFLFSEKDAAAAIEKTLPYVEKAEIKRSLSGTVTITVTAAKAVAAIDNGDAFILLNLSGKVLEDGVMTVNDDIVILEAGEVASAVPGEILVLADTAALADYTAVMQVFTEQEIVGVTQLDIRDRANIKAQYKDRILLKLGAANTVADKADFIKATLERNEKSTPEFRGSIDFSIEKKAYQNAEGQSATAAVPTDASGADTTAESSTASQAGSPETTAA